MTITQKYVDFIIDNIIQDTITVQLYKPMEDGARMSVKLGPMIHCKVQIEVIEKYTRSAKLKLTFDKYEHEDIFFIPFSSSPESIEIKTRKKIENIVNKTFIDDDRTDDIKQMYADKYINFAESLSKFISEKKMNKLDKIYRDLIDDAHNNYVKTSEPMLDGKYLSQPEFTYWIKTDDKFAKRWGITIETKELSEDERINLLHVKHGNKGHHIEAGFNMLDEFDIPTKLITITYNGETRESYE